MPPQDMFWGDRYGQLRDPFGVSWSLAGEPWRRRSHMARAHDRPLPPQAPALV